MVVLDGHEGILIMSDAITPNSLHILAPRKGGRPKSAAPMVPVMARIPERQYDRLIAIAAKSEQSVSSVVRQIIQAQTFFR